MKNKKFFKYVVLICLILILAAVTALSACGIQGDDAQETVTVTFDAAGGELDQSTLTVNKGEYIELPEPTRSGYIFDGWYYGTGVDAERFTNTTPIYDDITLIASWVGDFTEGLAYALNEDGKSYSCTGMGTYEGNIVKIAPDYNGLPVTAVAANAFAEEQSIEKVVIFDNVEKVENGAFSSCPNLKEWQFGSSVKYFGNSVGKSSRSVPSNIKVNYTGSIADWCKINFNKAYLFYPHGTLYLNNEPVFDLVIPDGVTAIKREAFAYCSSIKSVSIPDSVMIIVDEAFGSLMFVKELVIPDSVISIGEYAFTECYSLAKVTLGSGVGNIGYGAFDGCNNLIEVYNRSELNIVAGSEEFGKIGYNAKNVYTDEDGRSNIIKNEDCIFYNDGGEYYLMWYTGNESEIELPASIDGNGYGIYQYAFYNQNFTSVTIPDGVTSIGESVFSGCDYLTNVTIPDSVTSIGDFAFSGCDMLKNVYYGGTSDEWAQINFNYGNDALTAANIYYYSAEQPTETGNYWHYADGKVTVW